MDLTEDKEEEERKKTNPEEEGAQVETTTTNQQNDGDISEDEREDVERLVQRPTTYWPGGNRRFTWENLNVPMPSAVQRRSSLRGKKQKKIKKKTSAVQEEINTAAPTGQVEGEETRKTFKTLLDISSFEMSKNEVLQGALGFGIFALVALIILLVLRIRGEEATRD